MIEIKTIRAEKFVLIIGTNKTGKTTYLIKIIDRKLLSTNNRVLLINPNDERFIEVSKIDLNSKEILTFTGIRRADIFDKKDFNKILNFRKGLLILDDVRRFLPSNIPEAFLRLFIDFANFNLDVICVGHGFTSIPPVFYTYAKQLILFRTTDNIKLRKNQLGEHYKTLEKMSHEINQGFEAYGYKDFISLHKIYSFI